MDKANPILGIDFGTTNTSAAWFDGDGKLRIVPVTDRSNILPSVVWFHSAEKTVVGHAARAQIIEDPKNTVYEGKRFLTRRYKSEFVARNRDRFAFDIVDGPEGYCAARVRGSTVPFEDIAALVIDHVATLAAHAAGRPFKDCVLTVPVHASFRQRAAMRLAAERTGLDVRAIVNEPTAAALYYANLRHPQSTVLVFDLGGGTFDATLMSLKNRQVKVLATGGDAFLGGSNFDSAIVAHLSERFRDKTGLDLGESRVVMQRLAFAAESAKIALSSKEETRVRIPCVVQRDGQFFDLDETLTRSQLEDLVAPLIERSVGACEDVLARAGLKAEQVDELVLVGGQTRMPAIRRRLTNFKRFSEEREVHPELGVCIGAAILGRNLNRGTVGLTDVTPMSISVMMPGGVTFEAIPPNTPVPSRRKIIIEGLPPWQAPIPLAIFEAVDSAAIDREVFGTVMIGPEFRVKGAPTLHLDLAPDFKLKAKLSASGGPETVVPIVEVKAAR